MACLLVAAVSNESHAVDAMGRLLLFVSVSRMTDGQPVTGLGLDNFRIASSVGSVLDPKPVAVAEVEWEPGTGELSGCYRISVDRGRSEYDPSGQAPAWIPGESYAFGLQVRVFETHNLDEQLVEVPVDFGQTVVQLISLGT